MLFKKNRRKTLPKPSSKGLKPFAGNNNNLLSSFIAKFDRFRAKKARSKSKPSSRPSKSPKDKQVTSNMKIISIILLTVLALIILAPLILLISSFLRGYYNIDFQKEYGDNRVHEEEWKGDRRITVLLIGLDRKSEDIAFVDFLTILVLDPERKTVGVFDINTNITTYIPERKSYLSLKRLYNVGNDNENPESLDLLIEGVEEVTATSIDRYMSIEKEGMKELFLEFGSISIDSPVEIKDKDIQIEGEVFEINKGSNKVDEENILNYLSADDSGNDLKLQIQNSILKEMILKLDEWDMIFNLPYLSDSIKKNVKSDFSKSEFRRFVWSLREVSFHNVKTGYIKQNSVVENSGLLLPITERVDLDLSVIFFNIEVQKEQARVEVLNGSGASGIAGKRARNIANTGARVINIGNSRDNYDQTTIYTPNPEKYKNTILEIQSLFVKTPIVIEDAFPYRHTGDIVVVIGKDAVK